MTNAEAPGTTHANGAAPTPTEIIPAAMVRAMANDPNHAIGAFSSQGNFESAQRMAKALSLGSLMPTAFQNNIPNCLIALEMASRIGASVLAVAQSLDIIHGRPGWRATFLIGTVNSCGRFTPIRFRWQGTEGTDDWGCRAVAKDKSDAEPCVGALITIGLAKAEGWYSRNGSKWKTMPEQMLMYRAAAFWTRVYAPELSLGMHTSDEVAEQFGGTITQIDASSSLVSGSTKALEAELMDSKPPVTVVEEILVKAEPTAETAKAEKKSKAKASPEPPDFDKETGEVKDQGDAARMREPGSEG